TRARLQRSGFPLTLLAGFMLHEQLHGELLPSTRSARLVLAHRMKRAALCVGRSFHSRFGAGYVDAPEGDGLQKS
ncbi:MAG: hypothetical protein P4K98_10330, partial [Bryobacteraceae bacterium]|nr:hypothetical protein [Bryobacteraceae bacterium]